MSTWSESHNRHVANSHPHIYTHTHTHTHTCIYIYTHTYIKPLFSLMLSNVLLVSTKISHRATCGVLVRITVSLIYARFKIILYIFNEMKSRNNKGKSPGWQFSVHLSDSINMSRKDRDQYMCWSL